MSSDSMHLSTGVIIAQDSLRLSQPIDIRFRGYYEGERKLNSAEILARLSKQDSSIYLGYKRGRKAQRVGSLLVGVGGVTGVAGVIVSLGRTLGNIGSYHQNDNETPEKVIAFGGGGLMLIGVSQVIAGLQIKTKAIKRYNNLPTIRKERFIFYVKPGLLNTSVGIRF